MFRSSPVLLSLCAALLLGCGEEDFTAHADETTMRRISPPDALTYLVQVSATYHDVDAVRGDPDPDAGMCQYTQEGIIGASGEHEPFRKWVYTAKLAGVERYGQFDGRHVARVYLQAGVPANFTLFGGAIKVTGRSSSGPNNTCFAYVRRATSGVEDDLTNVISALRILGVRRL